MRLTPPLFWFQINSLRDCSLASAAA